MMCLIDMSQEIAQLENILDTIKSNPEMSRVQLNQLLKELASTRSNIKKLSQEVIKEIKTHLTPEEWTLTLSTCGLKEQNADQHTVSK